MGEDDVLTYRRFSFDWFRDYINNHRICAYLRSTIMKPILLACLMVGTLPGAGWAVSLPGDWTVDCIEAKPQERKELEPVKGEK